jgi:hypothetical protein
LIKSQQIYELVLVFLHEQPVAGSRIVFLMRPEAADQVLFWIAKFIFYFANHKHIDILLGHFISSSFCLTQIVKLYLNLHRRSVALLTILRNLAHIRALYANLRIEGFLLQELLMRLQHLVLLLIMIYDYTIVCFLVVIVFILTVSFAHLCRINQIGRAIRYDDRNF